MFRNPLKEKRANVIKIDEKQINKHPVVRQREIMENKKEKLSSQNEIRWISKW